MSSAARPLDIEQLKKRHKELEREKVTAEANLKSAGQQLDALKAEAQEKYGTRDLAELKKKLAEMKEENEQKRAAYQRHLIEIEGRLKQVEDEFKEAE